MKNLIAILSVILCVFVVQTEVQNVDVNSPPLIQSVDAQESVDTGKSDENENESPNWLLIGGFLLLALEILFRFVPKTRDFTPLGILYEILNKIIPNKARFPNKFKTGNFKIKGEEDPD